MADELVPGLDISGFSPDKLARLNEFISVFAKLETFHGKAFSPLSGSGVTEFNVSLKETNDLLTQMNIKLGSISSAQIGMTEQAVSGNRRLKRSIDDNTNSLAHMGRELTHAYGWLRRIAYILPGIGIAGIFNLAYKGIEKAAEGLGVFSSRTEKLIDFEKAQNKALLEQIKLYEKLYQLRKGLSEVDDIPKADVRKTEVAKLRGTPKDILLQQEIDNAKLNAQNIEAQLLVSGNNPQVLQTDLNRRLDLMQQYAAKISDIQKKIDRTENRSPDDKTVRKDKSGKIIRKVPIGQTVDVDVAKKQKEVLQSQLDIQTEAYNKDKKLLDDFVKYTREAEDKSAELSKFNDDEKRKSFIKEETEKLNTIIATNDLIIKEERYSEEQKIKAVEAVREANKGIIGLGLFNVTGDRTSTAKQVVTAKQSAKEENIRNEIKSNNEVADIHESYRQRNLKAVAETDKNEIDAEAEKNQRIFENVEKSLEERLLAYEIYIKDKLKEQDIEYAKDKEKLGQTDKEKAELESNRDSQKLKITADSEKKIFDIVYSWSQEQLKNVIKTNKLQEQDNKKTLSEELERLNNSFADKKIGYKKYIKDRQVLENSYRIKEYDEDVKNDRQELSRLRRLLVNHKKVRDEFQTKANDAKSPKEKEDSLSGVAASNDAIANVSQAILDKSKTLDDHLLRLAKSKGDKELQYKKELAANKIKIEENLFNLSKTIIDAQTEYELEKLARKQKATDETFDNQIANIDKSSESEKDKTALDIQLNEQKKESDKNAMVAERKLKHDQAVIDRELTIAHIIWATELAIAESLTRDLGISEAILGAIALATVMATPIPSFAEGVTGFSGGIARYGEAGTELVKEPYKSPYLVHSETIGYLPRGTDIIPMRESPVFGSKSEDSSWQQTEFLANVIRKNNKDIKNIFKPTIVFNDKFENYKRKILGN